MKSWFARLKISTALDDSRKPSGSLPVKVSHSEELRGFEQEMAALDRALKDSSPKVQVPASLHRSIMRGVAAARRPAGAQPWLAFLRWLAVPAAAVVALLVVWQASRGPVQPAAPAMESLAAAARTLEMGDRMAQKVPSVMVAPLSDELERLNRDLDNTAEFLLASLP
jgi:hypothetical protein